MFLAGDSTRERQLPSENRAIAFLALNDEIKRELRVIILVDPFIRIIYPFGVGDPRARFAHSG